MARGRETVAGGKMAAQTGAVCFRLLRKQLCGFEQGGKIGYLTAKAQRIDAAKAV